ncbi:hypothetical protein D3C84_1193380 [compost metagenome]
MKTGGLGLLDLGLAQAAFRADQECQALRLLVADQRLGHRVQDQLELFITGLEPVGQQYRWVDLRHA